jgi:hypothetical protein
MYSPSAMYSLYVAASVSEWMSVAAFPLGDSLPIARCRGIVRVHSRTLPPTLIMYSSRHIEP